MEAGRDLAGQYAAKDMRHHEKSADSENQQEDENRDADPAAAACLSQLCRTSSDHRSALQIDVVGLGHWRLSASQDPIDPTCGRMVRMRRW
jgi:hypothetical protein